MNEPGTRRSPRSRRSRRATPALAALALAAIALAATSCASAGRVTNLRDGDCATSFARALADLLMTHGESLEQAQTLAAMRTVELAGAAEPPGRFVVVAGGGVEHDFAVEVVGGRCRLRLAPTTRESAAAEPGDGAASVRPLPGCVGEPLRDPR